MSTHFAFVPRKVLKFTKGQTPRSAQAEQLEASIGTASAVHAPQAKHVKALASVSTPDKGKSKFDGAFHSDGKHKYSGTDYAFLVCLALSDYALWSNPDLRRSLHLGEDTGEGSGNEGFIPLVQLLKQSPILSCMGFGDSEMLIAKALRALASELLEVRMLVSDSTTWSWHGRHNKDRGLYEVRRKDWDKLPQTKSKTDWEVRTVYIENIPIQYRSIPGIVRFMLALLPQDASSVGSRMPLIQGVTLLPHHQDKPGDQPVCKGFALVTLASSSDVDHLIKQWPWHRDLEGATMDSTVVDSGEVAEASKFGLRVLIKARWEELKREYLAHRQSLIDEINASEDADPISHPLPPQREGRHELVAQAAPKEAVARSEGQQLNFDSPYPFGCLVFARNVHPGTNKTALRTLFTTALKLTLSSEGEGLDYVDFNKGMDTCHLRLATPKHAQSLAAHFSANLIAQTDGLDDKGGEFTQANAAIVMEVVEGKREQLYWERVPEKIRRQAVQNAISFMHPVTTSNSDGRNASVEQVEHTETRKRKRREREA